MQGAPVQVYVVPLEPQRFRLPQSNGEGDSPASGVAGLAASCEHSSALLHVEGLRGHRAARRWGVDKRGDVAPDLAAALPP